MSNKLRDIFSDEEQYHTVKMHFKDISSSKEFLKKFNDMWESGEAVSIEGIEKISETMKSSTSEFPLVENLVISEVVMSPLQEEIIIPLEVNEYIGQIKLYRTTLKEKYVIHSEREAAVKFYIEVNPNSGKIVFKQSLQLQNAKNVEELVNQFKQAEAFIQLLFQKDKEIIERDDMINLFSKGQHYFKHLLELEKVIGIQFKTEMIEKDEKSILLAEELYLMLIKKEKIRRNRSLNSLSNVSIKEEITGKEILLTLDSEKSYELYGERIKIYEVSCFFNMIVSKIENNKDDKENSKKIFFTESDSKPAYSVYSGFFTEKDAIEEKQKLSEKIEEYRNAKSIDEYLKML